MAMRIEPSGQVTVMIPRFLDIKIAQRFFESRINWVRKQQDLRREMAIRYPKREFMSGESFSVFGRNYRLNIKSNKKRSVCRIEHNRLIVRVYPVTREKIKEILQGLLLKHTVCQAKVIVKRYAPRVGVSVNKVLASSQKQRWGSCSKKGEIRINFLLAMAPLRVFNYVVAHEICHLKYHNHSEKFWRTLKSVLPDYEKSRLWLKENVGLMTSFE